MVQDALRWLTRANAKRIFYYSLAFLALACVWRLWKELSPATPSALAEYTPPAWRPERQINVVNYMNAQLSAAPEVSGDPFLVAMPGLAERPSSSWASRKTEAPAIEPAETPKPMKKLLRTSRPPTENKRTLGLIYRGMMVRPDGKTVALIEDRATKARRFYTEGDQVDWLSIGGIQLRHVEIRSADGGVVPLKLDSPMIFEEVNRGD